MTLIIVEPVPAPTPPSTSPPVRSGSPRPNVIGLADEAHEQLGPYSKPDSDETQWALLRLLDGLLAPLQPVEDLVRDRGERPGYSQALDVDEVPPGLLRWLGQFKGVRVTVGDPADRVWVESARDEVRQAAGFRRGTRQTMVLAAQKHLSGNKSVRILERDSSPYHLTVIVRPSEVPKSDLGVSWDETVGSWDAQPGTWDSTTTTIVKSAVMAQKPAGLVLAFLITDSPLIDEGTRQVDAATATIDSAQLADVT